MRYMLNPELKVKYDDEHWPFYTDKFPQHFNKTVPTAHGEVKLPYGKTWPQTFQHADHSLSPGMLLDHHQLPPAIHPTTAPSKLLASTIELKTTNPLNSPMNSLHLISLMKEHRVSTADTYWRKRALNHTWSRRGEIAAALTGRSVTYVFRRVRVLVSHNCSHVNNKLSQAFSITASNSATNLPKGQTR